MLFNSFYGVKWRLHMILLASKKKYIMQNIIEKYFWDQMSKNIELYTGMEDMYNYKGFGTYIGIELSS